MQHGTKVESLCKVEREAKDGAKEPVREKKPVTLFCPLRLAASLPTPSSHFMATPSSPVAGAYENEFALAASAEVCLFCFFFALSSQGLKMIMRTQMVFCMRTIIFCIVFHPNGGLEMGEKSIRGLWKRSKRTGEN